MNNAIADGYRSNSYPEIVALKSQARSPTLFTNLCQNRITFSIPNSMQDARSLIHQAHTENWEELDRSGMNLTELPPEIVCLTGLRSLILGKEEVGEWKDGEYVPTTIANQLTTLPEELGIKSLQYGVKLSTIDEIG